MSGGRAVHALAGGLCVAAALACGALACLRGGIPLLPDDGRLVAVLVATAVAVQAVRAFRLYLLLHERLGARAFLWRYCVAALVGVLLPFKAGELFRVYSFGRALGDYPLAVAAVLVDRGADTAALLGAIVALRIVYGGSFSALFYLLVLFLSLLLAAFMLFPGVAAYWTGYFVQAPATERRLWCLGFVGRCASVRRTFAGILRGKGASVLMLSALAWGVELGGAALSCTFLLLGQRRRMMPEYVGAALTGGGSAYLRQFVLVTALVLLACSAAGLAGTVRAVRGAGRNGA